MRRQAVSRLEVAGSRDSESSAVQCSPRQECDASVSGGSDLK